MAYLSAVIPAPILAILTPGSAIIAVPAPPTSVTMIDDDNMEVGDSSARCRCYRQGQQLAGVANYQKRAGNAGPAGGRKYETAQP